MYETYTREQMICVLAIFGSLLALTLWAWFRGNVKNANQADLIKKMSDRVVEQIELSGHYERERNAAAECYTSAKEQLEIAQRNLKRYTDANAAREASMDDYLNEIDKGLANVRRILRG